MIPLATHSPDFDPSLPWEELENRELAQTRLFRLAALHRRSPQSGREHAFTRINCPDWVNVIAFRALEIGGELLVVEQFRHGIDASTLEIIGGVCEPGEDPAQSAARELREETGHRPGRIVSLGSCTPNPAVQNNRCHFYLALDCRPEGPLELDPSEELRLWALDLEEWETRLQNGTFHHALVMAAFLRLGQWEGWPRLRDQMTRSHGAQRS